MHIFLSLASLLQTPITFYLRSLPKAIKPRNITINRRNFTIYNSIIDILYMNYISMTLYKKDIPENY